MKAAPDVEMRWLFAGALMFGLGLGLLVAVLVAMWMVFA